MNLESGSHRYEVGNLVASADGYRLYLCEQECTGRQCLLQIAAAVENNGELDRAAYVLAELKGRSDETEAEYARVKTDPRAMLNYDLAFPELVDSFICQQQGGRRINVLAFRNVEKVNAIVPLIGVTARDGLRVDLRTSAWIMGKLLKLLVFAHSGGYAIGNVAGGNILIDPDQHYVLIFDWSAATTYPGEIPDDVCCEEISLAARAVITVLGGDAETGSFLDDGDAGFARYTEHLAALARGSERSAQRAHERFYELVDELWEREFYPFTTCPLT